MKKIISGFLILALCLGMLSGCKEDESDIEAAIDSALQTYFEETLDVLETDSNDKITNYLVVWASGRDNIKVSFDDYNNVIMSSKATGDEYSDTDDTILHCTLNLDDCEQTAREISVILYALENTENHGFIRAIFTSASQPNKVDGANEISKKYLSGENLVSLDWGANNSLLVGSAGTTTYSVVNPLNWQAPAYTNAYEISISGLPGGSSADFSVKQPNAIRTIGDFLATLKTKGILFELAGFNGGDSVYNFPQGATAVVIITQNDINKFTKWIEYSQEKFDDKYGDELMAAAREKAIEDVEEQLGTEAALGYEPDIESAYQYTCTEIPLPEHVMSSADCNRLVSFLYTMPNGTYFKSDEGAVVATTNVGQLSTFTGNLLVDVCARSLNIDTLAEISNVVDTVCGLSDMSYTVGEAFPVWEAAEYKTGVINGTEASEVNEPESSVSDPAVFLFDRFNDSANKIFGKDAKRRTTLKRTACAVFKERVPELNVIGFGVEEKHLASQTEVLMDYLTNVNAPLSTPNEEL